MNAIVTNAVQRSLGRMFPGWFSLSDKHDHYKDFGWPDQVTFDHFYRMYSRNGIAAAAVDLTAAKTWESNPKIWESIKPAETQDEEDIRRAFAKLRVWQKMAEADKRSMVGEYAGVILRLRDSKNFDQPVDRVAGGLDGIAELIPAWQGQLTVSNWGEDPRSENYGKPTMYQFTESAVGDQQQPRSFHVHPDRVLIWSDDGTVNCQSMLQPGYNDLIDMEKIKGAGGEGFWKTTKGTFTFEADAGVTPAQVAEGMGVPVSGLQDALNDQVNAVNRGFDPALMTGGFKAKALAYPLPQPEQFFFAPLSSFAASFLIPVKILIGNQTGERASTEDARSWAQRCNSRRVNRCLPIIHEFLERLVQWGILAPMDWHVEWDDLTEASTSEKTERAKAWSDMNAQTQPGDDPPFTSEEIREVAGAPPRAVD